MKSKTALWNYYPVSRDGKKKEPWMDNPVKLTGRKPTMKRKRRVIRRRVKRVVRRVAQRVHRRRIRRNPMALFGMNPIHRATGLGRRVRLTTYRKGGLGSPLTISPFSRSVRKMRKYRLNPMAIGKIIPKALTSKETVTMVIGATVGYFATQMVPRLLPNEWQVANTWQNYLAKAGTVVASYIAVDKLLKKKNVAQAVLVGGLLSIAVDALKANVPQLAGTGVYIKPAALRPAMAGVGVRTMAPGKTTVPVRPAVSSVRNMHEERYA